LGAYILRRLLLVIPTLFGMMLINFALTQFVPGGPIDQIEARLQGEGDAIQALGGGGGDSAGQGEEAGGGRERLCRCPRPATRIPAKLEVEFGFARFVCDRGLCRHAAA
jgi:microcin C transport system permease protein